MRPTRSSGGPYVGDGVVLAELTDGAAAVGKTRVMPDLLVVTGPPGAGKSTVASMLAERVVPSVVVRGDDFFAHLHEGAIDPWLPEADEQNRVVLAAAAAATGRFVDGGYPTIFDGVVGPWHLRSFVRAAGVRSLDYVVLLPPLDAVLDRVATRTGHGFTDAEAAAHMHGAFSRADVEPRHVMAGEQHPADLVRAIEVARSAGSLRWS